MICGFGFGPRAAEAQSLASRSNCNKRAARRAGRCSADLQAPPRVRCSGESGVPAVLVLSGVRTPKCASQPSRRRAHAPRWYDSVRSTKPPLRVASRRCLTNAPCSRAIGTASRSLGRVTLVSSSHQGLAGGSVPGRQEGRRPSQAPVKLPTRRPGLVATRMDQGRDVATKACVIVGPGRSPADRAPAPLGTGSAFSSSLRQLELRRGHCLAATTETTHLSFVHR